MTEDQLVEIYRANYRLVRTFGGSHDAATSLAEARARDLRAHSGQRFERAIATKPTPAVSNPGEGKAPKEKARHNANVTAGVANPIHPMRLVVDNRKAPGS